MQSLKLCFFFAVVCEVAIQALPEAARAVQDHEEEGGAAEERGKIVLR